MALPHEVIILRQKEEALKELKIKLHNKHDVLSILPTVAGVRHHHPLEDEAARPGWMSENEDEKLRQLSTDAETEELQRRVIALRELEEQGGLLPASFPTFDTISPLYLGMPVAKPGYHTITTRITTVDLRDADMETWIHMTLQFQFGAIQAFQNVTEEVTGLKFDRSAATGEEEMQIALERLNIQTNMDARDILCRWYSDNPARPRVGEGSSQKESAPPAMWLWFPGSRNRGDQRMQLTTSEVIGKEKVAALSTALETALSPLVSCCDIHEHRTWSEPCPTPPTWTLYGEELVFRGIHGAFYGLQHEEDDEEIDDQPQKLLTCMELYHQEGRCVVARAIITYSDDNCRGGSDPCLEILEVAQQWRGQGLARWLLRRIEAWLSKALPKAFPETIVLWSWSHNLDLHGEDEAMRFFFGGQGFKFVDERHLVKRMPVPVLKGSSYTFGAAQGSVYVATASLACGQKYMVMGGDETMSETMDDHMQDLLPTLKGYPQPEISDRCLIVWDIHGHIRGYVGSSAILTPEGKEVPSINSVGNMLMYKDEHVITQSRAVGFLVMHTLRFPASQGDAPPPKLLTQLPRIVHDTSSGPGLVWDKNGPKDDVFVGLDQDGESLHFMSAESLELLHSVSQDDTALVNGRFELIAAASGRAAALWKSRDDDVAWISVWSTSTGERLAHFEHHLPEDWEDLEDDDGYKRCLAMNDRYVVMMPNGGGVYCVYNAASGELVRNIFDPDFDEDLWEEMEMEEGIPFPCMALTSRHLIATAQKYPHLNIYDIESGDRVLKLEEATRKDTAAWEHRHQTEGGFFTSLEVVGLNKIRATCFGGVTLMWDFDSDVL